MTLGAEHLIIAPILIPFFAGALMLLYDDRQRGTKSVISTVSALAMLAVAVELLNQSKSTVLPGGTDVSLYLLGDWPVPFGIVLVLDRLSAMMLLLTALLAIPTLLYASAGWQRRGPQFHSLFQFLLMGLNGAFLTGDLFNLFVFFEVLLAASYGLLLHGTGQLRVRAGLHYIAINLFASLLFLIGVSLIYGATGTLNMAQLSQAMAGLPEASRPMVHAGAGVLGVAFLIKAGVWPLSFWLPTTYMAASAPVAAMFAIMTKVGVYVLIRVSTLVFGATAGVSAGFGADVLVVLGLLTAVFGFLGVLGSQGLGRMAAHLVLVSSGTMLAVCGFALAGGGWQLLGGGLYYLVSSTLATAALFLIIEPMSREEGGISAMLALTADAYGLDEAEEESQPEVGMAIPGTLTVLGLAFGVCLLALAGLPPLSGFIGKLAMLLGLFGAEALSPVARWAFLAVVLVSGLATLVGLVRVGIQTFWAGDGTAPPVLALEIAPVVILVGLIGLMTVNGQDALRYTQAAARALLDPAANVGQVLSAPRAAAQNGEAAP